MVVINDDVQGEPPNGADAAAFDEAAGSLGIPVTADATDQVLSSTPWTGLYRPGKCVLSPEMVMLGCYTGPDDAAAFNLIEAHAAAR